MYAKFITPHGEEVRRYCIDLPRNGERVILHGLEKGHDPAYEVVSVSWYEKQELDEVLSTMMVPTLQPVVMLA